MTVPVQTPFTSSVANGVTTVFPYSFMIADEDDIKVVVDGVVQTTGYTVSGIGDPAGGNVTFAVAPANGSKVLRYLDPILWRETDYQQFGDFLADTVNLDFDRVWLALQSLRQNFNRSLKLPVDTATDQTIQDDAAARVGKVVSFDASGNMILKLPADLSEAAFISAFMETFLAAVDASAARTTLGLVIGTDVQAFAASASQAEMETGTESALRAMSPLRVKQAIAALASGVQIQPISASVGSNALTISASALSLDFRSTTLGSGTVTKVAGTPSNLVISSGSTLGTVNGQQSRIAVLALNNAGTIELAAVNIAGASNLNESGVVSTTAEGGAGAADSATTIYSTTARTNVAYRVLGYIESTQATAGTWATAPSVIQGAGGQSSVALAMNSPGSAPMFACRAWVNFNGTGTVAIRASGNVSSITDNGTGDYTINFINAMPDANYALAQMAGDSTISAIDCGMVSSSTAPTTSAVRVIYIRSGVGATDLARCCVAVFR